jgi:large subunit ribosomal protein L20
MARVKTGTKRRRHHKKWIKMAKGSNQRRGNTYKAAQENVQRALEYGFVHRKLKKRDFRRLWIIRINAAVRELGLSYSRFVAMLKKKNVGLDRKVLADIAVHDREGFQKIVETVRA